MTPERALVGPCGRLVNFYDRLACLDLLVDSVTHDSNFVFYLEARDIPPAWSLPRCAAMNMATADRQ
jgi:hypothetical protein